MKQWYANLMQYLSDRIDRVLEGMPLQEVYEHDKRQSEILLAQAKRTIHRHQYIQFTEEHRLRALQEWYELNLKPKEQGDKAEPD